MREHREPAARARDGPAEGDLIRLAIGASRARLIRQLLTEGVVLAAIGGAAGLAAAGWGSRLLARLASRGGPNPVPFDVDVVPDLAVLAFTATVALLTTIVFALVPAVRSTRLELSAALRDGARSPDLRGWSVGKLLVIGQLALSRPAPGDRGSIRREPRLSRGPRCRLCPRPSGGGQKRARRPRRRESW